MPAVVSNKGGFGTSALFCSICREHIIISMKRGELQTSIVYAISQVYIG